MLPADDRHSARWIGTLIALHRAPSSSKIDVTPTAAHSARSVASSLRNASSVDLARRRLEPLAVLADVRRPLPLDVADAGAAVPDPSLPTKRCL